MYVFVWLGHQFSIDAPKAEECYHHGGIQKDRGTPGSFRGQLNALK
jgi:hypothetical protein